MTEEMDPSFSYEEENCLYDVARITDPLEIKEERKPDLPLLKLELFSTSNQTRLFGEDVALSPPAVEYVASLHSFDLVTKQKHGASMSDGNYKMEIIEHSVDEKPPLCATSTPVGHLGLSEASENIANEMSSFCDTSMPMLLPCGMSEASQNVASDESLWCFASSPMFLLSGICEPGEIMTNEQPLWCLTSTPMYMFSETSEQSQNMANEIEKPLRITSTPVPLSKPSDFSEPKPSQNVAHEKPPYATVSLPELSQNIAKDFPSVVTHDFVLPVNVPAALSNVPLQVMRKFRCKKCLMSFELKQDYQNHRKTHKPVKRFACWVCAGTGQKPVRRRESVLTRHMKRRHDGEKPFRCETCGQCLSAYKSLTNHINNIHYNETRFNCWICKRPSNNELALFRHMKQYHDGKNPFCCTICERLFPTFHTYNRHFCIKRPDEGFSEEKCLKCPDCTTEFKFYVDLQRHVMEEHSESVSVKSEKSFEREKCLKCPGCQMEFKFDLDRRRHIKKKHFNSFDLKYAVESSFQEEKCVKCVECQMEFRFDLDLQRHIKSTHATDTSVQCETCGKCFRRKDSLLAHSCVSAPVRYDCSLCDKSYAKKRTLSWHMADHRGLRPCPCAVCGKRFLCKWTLRHHAKTHSAAPAAAFKCLICERSFRQKKALKYHIQWHTGAKPLQCHICQERFTNRTNLNLHLKLHLGVRPFKCDACDKCYVNKPRLARHIRKSCGRSV